MFQIFKKIKKIFKILKNILALKKKNPKIIFYSEGKSYQKYAYIILNVLTKRFPNQIWYVSSDENDFIEDLNINNLFIGKDLLMEYFFLTIKAENLILTLTDLNNHQVKKTKNINNYIYYFHAPGSTSKVYTETAFDNYDTILCNGDYQINEIRKREKSKKLKKKNLVKSGYFYFDYLKDKIDNQVIADEILIAPSWNYNQKEFINKNVELLINKLIENGHKVRFRPHPENLKRSRLFLDKIRSRFYGNQFIFDDHPENLESMEKAKFLITDASGIAIEYVLIFNRPVLYFDEVDKIHNNNFQAYKDLISIDQRIKDTFGYNFKKNEIDNIEIILSKAMFEFNKKENQIEKFLNKNFYNFGTTQEKLNENIDKIL